MQNIVYYLITMVRESEQGFDIVGISESEMSMTGQMRALQKALELRTGVRLELSILNDLSSGLGTTDPEQIELEACVMGHLPSSI